MTAGRGPRLSGAPVRAVQPAAPGPSHPRRASARPNASGRQAAKTWVVAWARSEVSPVWALSAVLALLATGMYLGPVHRMGPSGGTVGLAMDGGLVLMFFAAEVFVVHVKFYRETHTFSLSEIPLVLALFYVTPGVLIAAQLLGSGLALVAHRRQRPLKLCFNLASFAASTTCAVLVFHAIDPSDRLGQTGWVAALAAVLVSSSIGVTSVFSAVAISDRSSSVPSPVPALEFGLLGALITGSLGLIAAVVQASHPLGVLLCLVPVVGVFAANRAYAGEREKHQSLQFLYDSTRLLNQAAELKVAIASMLSQAREAVGADVAALAHLSDVGDRLVVSRVGPGPATGMMQDIELSALGPLWDMLTARPGSLSFAAGAGDDLLAGLLGDVELVDGLVVPMRGETRLIGVLVVANHLRAVGRFGADAERLLETLASHLVIALENGRLTQSLAELRTLQDELTYQATHDSLTQLPNRALFIESTARAVAENRPGHSVAVLFVDLDNFKVVNDGLGHAAGDELLVAVAKRIGDCLEEGWLAARLGGDEFAIVMPGVEDHSTPGQVAQRIIESLGRLVPLRGAYMPARASIGVAISTPRDTASELMRNADTAMYGAKARGKGRWVVFSRELHETAVRRQELSCDLGHGVGAGELTVYFQPMVELATGRASGAEALVRWRHPTRGLLLPDTFIALAEETGDITRVTQFVLAESCRLAKSWSRPGLGAVPTVSVNVSIQDFDSAGFAQLVERALSSTGLPPDRLVLEITETLMLDDPTGVLIVLRQLSNLGVRIALDDFGTGYSSLSQIVRLPLDSIKIAKPLVDALGIDPRADSLVRGLVELGHALDLQLVAEGIESSSQLALLQEFGCDVGQGYLFSKPVSASQFDTWMQTNGGTVPLVGTVPSASAPTGPPRLPVVGGAGELSPLEHVSVSR